MVFEIYKGFLYNGSNKKIQRFEKFLSPIEIFYLNKKILSGAGKIFAKLRKEGKTIGDGDILIAATVIDNNGILVSNNTKHFKNIEELRLTNWI